MDDDGRYRVTRAGREVFAGNQRALVDAARAGRVRDSDLVFDPSTDNWVFARSHPLLDRLTDATPPPGAVRPVRPRRKPLDSTPTPIAGAEGRRATRQRAARKRLLFGLSVFFAAVAAVGLWMLFGPGGPGEAMSAYFEEREREQNEPHVPEMIEGAEGVAVAPEAPGPPGEGTGGQAAQAAVEVVDPLTFDTAWRSADSEAIELSDAERLAYGARYHDAARQVLELEKPPPGDARLDQLLAARHRAEFARINLERVDPKHPDIDRVGSTLGDIETDFQTACRAEHGERFCELKWKWPDWPDAVVGFVADEKVVVGMTADQVRASWGRPTRLRRTAGGRQFCYGQLCGRSVTIVNDVAVQVSD